MITTANFKIDSPPSLGNDEETPLILMLGPSLTMGMSAMFMAMYTIQNVTSTGASLLSALPMVMMSVAMMMGMILWPILMRQFEKKKRKEKRALRRKKYGAYLEDINNRIIAESENQTRILHENFVSADECIKRVKNRTRDLWDRTKNQSDYLKVRLGIGDVELDYSLQYEEEKFTLDDDDMQKEMHIIADKKRMLHHVPVTISLRDEKVIGVIGKRQHVFELIKSLLIQITAFHSYDEVKIIFLYDKSEDWGFVRWLPHCFTDNKEIRFVANEKNHIKDISHVLSGEISIRREIKDEKQIKKQTNYVVFALDKNLAREAEFINTILSEEQNYGFTVLCFYDNLKSLPKECTSIVEISENSKVLYKSEEEQKVVEFKADALGVIDMNQYAKEISNISLSGVQDVFQLPPMVDFMQLHKSGKVEYLNCVTRWKENNPVTSLNADIGVDEHGNTLGLDIHEKAHGPHGLIAGMTGSGKSEFIMTYILSMAVNFHPYELAFILIDYKGGGMADAFRNLPHLAGTITNLDGNEINRSLMSIESELKRRQRIFSDTGKELSINNIDIYVYQQLFREGKVTEPLPHLLVISDEFAELKTQQPEFMEKLVSAARIGRSLGVHLILATQKPSGIIDDQIWSNARFRVCLKVQEKADSMDVIKRPDAASLSNIGRFYLQVGYNEIFTLGQAAWAGERYYPSEKTEVKKADSVQIIDMVGRVSKSAKLDKRKNKSNIKQIDAVCNYIDFIASQEKVKTRRLWLDPLPKKLLLNEVRNKYKKKESKFVINPIIGEIDMPYNQKQDYYSLDITNSGNTIIFGNQGSGKTTLLTTMLYDIIDSHTVEEVSIYIIDFGLESLTMFKKAPQVGDVVVAGEMEKLQNLFKMISKEVKRRRRILSSYGGGYASYLKSNSDLDNIVIVLNNFSAFYELSDELNEEFISITRECSKYGINFIVTAQSYNAVSYRVIQNFKQVIGLQVNDINEYSMFFGKISELCPATNAGRGIVKTDQVYEMQIAVVTTDFENVYSVIEQYCESIPSSVVAKRIPVAPQKVDAEYFGKIKNSFSMPVGVDMNTFENVEFDFEKRKINLILSENRDSVLVGYGICEAFVKANITTKLINVIKANNGFTVEGMEIFENKTEIEKEIEKLCETIQYKSNKTDDEKIVYMFFGFSKIKDIIDEKLYKKLVVSLQDFVNLNLSLITCETTESVNSLRNELFYKECIGIEYLNPTNNHIIWAGSGLNNQMLMDITSSMNDVQDNCGEGYGYIIEGRKEKFVKLLMPSDYMEVES